MEGRCILPPLPTPGKRLQKRLQKTTGSLVGRGRGRWTRPDPARPAPRRALAGPFHCPTQEGEGEASVGAASEDVVLGLRAQCPTW